MNLPPPHTAESPSFIRARRNLVFSCVTYIFIKTTGATISAIPTLGISAVSLKYPEVLNAWFGVLIAYFFLRYHHQAASLWARHDAVGIREMRNRCLGRYALDSLNTRKPEGVERVIAPVANPSFDDEESPKKAFFTSAKQYKNGTMSEPFRTEETPVSAIRLQWARLSGGASHFLASSFWLDVWLPYALPLLVIFTAWYFDWP